MLKRPLWVRRATGRRGKAGWRREAREGWRQGLGGAAVGSRAIGSRRMGGARNDESGNLEATAGLLCADVAAGSSGGCVPGGSQERCSTPPRGKKHVMCHVRLWGQEGARNSQGHVVGRPGGGDRRAV